MKAALPKYENLNVAYKLGGDNQDIRDLLESLVPRAASQMRKAAPSFRGRNEKETCQNIFNYIRQNFTYVVDGKEQVIKLPSALLKKRVGDCKSFSLFTAAILENLRIPYSFVYTSYNSDPTPGHVYVHTDGPDGGCIIDAVYGIFNEEKTSTFKYRKKMNVRYIGSTQNISPAGAAGAAGVGECGYYKQGRRIKGVGYIGSIGKGKPVRKIALAPGRGVFLALVKSNLDGFASKLQKIDPAKLKRTWENIGGDYSKLVKAIKTGASKPARRLGFLGLLRKRLKKRGINGVSGIGAASDAEVQAAIVAAATALGTALPGVGNVAGATAGAVLAALYPVVRDMVAMTPDAEETDNLIQTPGIVPDAEEVQSATQGSETGPTVKTGVQFDLQRSLPLVAAAGLALYFVTKK